ncbi:MAG: hypothetical protein BWX86_00558 [Verrucomicrobia bacterium ADurb.Bin122]|nr:MAG: hypothetical protein BWX86_00558 [Verrucomicrobia bacterium ADurb.Bin122]HOG92668.1 hypothetical protein [Opitutaceae bacterium]
MRWSDIKRINGFSTPFVGVQWTPPANQRDLASRLLAFLEDRRVLYREEEREGAQYCLRSVEMIRDFLTQIAPEIGGPKELPVLFKKFRKSCREFCDYIGDPSYPTYKPVVREALFRTSLADLRAHAGRLVGALAMTYQIDVDDDLATIIPFKPE